MNTAVMLMELFIMANPTDSSSPEPVRPRVGPYPRVRTGAGGDCSSYAVEMSRPASLCRVREAFVKNPARSAPFGGPETTERRVKLTLVARIAAMSGCTIPTVSM